MQTDPTLVWQKWLADEVRPGLEQECLYKYFVPFLTQTKAISHSTHHCNIATSWVLQVALRLRIMEPGACETSKYTRVAFSNLLRIAIISMITTTNTFDEINYPTGFSPRDTVSWGGLGMICLDESAQTIVKFPNRENKDVMLRLKGESMSSIHPIALRNLPIQKCAHTTSRTNGR
jgi:hypothetical protein